MFNKHVLIHGHVLDKYGIQVDKNHNPPLKDLTLNVFAY